MGGLAQTLDKSNSTSVFRLKRKERALSIYNTPCTFHRFVSRNDRKMSGQNIGLPPSVFASSYGSLPINIEAFGYLLAGHSQQAQLSCFLG